VKHIKQVVIAVDQLVNTVLCGWADETLSSRAWRAEQSGNPYGKVCRYLIDIIFFFDANHCYESYVSERDRTQIAPELRNFE